MSTNKQKEINERIAKDTNELLMFLVIMLSLISLFAFLASSCGPEEHGHVIIIDEGGPNENPQENPQEVFNEEKVKASCFGSSCHGGSQAPRIPSIGAGFKTDKKVRARVLAKTMPQGGFSDAKLKAFISYLDSQ